MFCLTGQVCSVYPDNFTLRFSRVWHADVLKTLALLNRMHVLTEGQFQLSLLRAEHHFSEQDLVTVKSLAVVGRL